MIGLTFAANLLLLGLAAMLLVIAAASADITEYDTPMTWEEDDENDDA